MKKTKSITKAVELTPAQKDAQTIAEEISKGVAWRSRQVSYGKEFGEALAVALKKKGFRVGEQYSTMGHKADFEIVLERRGERYEITSTYLMGAFTQIDRIK